MKSAAEFAVLAVGVIMCSGLPATGQSAANQAVKEAPRTAEGKPDFSGFYNIPYTPNMARGQEGCAVHGSRPSGVSQSRFEGRPNVELLVSGRTANHAVSLPHPDCSDARLPGVTVRVHVNVSIDTTQWAAPCGQHGTLL